MNRKKLIISGLAALALIITVAFGGSSKPTPAGIYSDHGDWIVEAGVGPAEACVAFSHQRYHPDLAFRRVNDFYLVALQEESFHLAYDEPIALTLAAGPFSTTLNGYARAGNSVFAGMSPATMKDFSAAIVKYELKVESLRLKTQFSTDGLPAALRDLERCNR